MGIHNMHWIVCSFASACLCEHMLDLIQESLLLFDVLLIGIGVQTVCKSKT